MSVIGIQAMLKELFFHCESLEVLNSSNFNTSKITTMAGMFSYCISLNTIYVGKQYDNSKVNNSEIIFTNCCNLKGAIAYDSTKVDINYANWETGYFTLYN